MSGSGRSKRAGANFKTIMPSESHEEKILNLLRRIECRVEEIERKTVSAISDFNDKLTEFFARQDTAITDLQGDVKNLEDQITALQNSAGQITPSDQALLDGIVQRVSVVSDKLDALDQLTPPVAPPPPPVTTP